MANSNFDLQKAYKAFFSDLVSTLKTDHKFSTNLKIAGKNYHNFPTGFSGIRYACGFHPKQDSVEVALYMSGEDAKEVFDFLVTQKLLIESEFGSSLIWNRQNNQVRSRIAIERSGSIMDHPNNLKQTQQWMVHNLSNFREVFSPRTKELKGKK